MNLGIQRPIRVLHLDSSSDDVELLQHHLRAGGLHFTARRVETPDTFLSALREFSPDVVISEYGQPAIDGREALEIARGASPNLPVIFASGAQQEEAASELIRAGAADFVAKDRPMRLSIAVERAMAAASEIRARHVAEAAVRHERLRAERQRSAHEEALRRSLEESMRALALVVEMRDPYTAGHQSRVADLARAIARALRLDPDRIRGIELAASIHDVGKIGVPAEILGKPGRLTASEMEIVRSYAQAGYEIVKNVHFAWPIAEMIWQHHERLDGSGYPRGLKGDQIMLDARIISVSDVVDAMTGARPYRAALGIDAALAEIVKGRGTLYDASVVDACVALFRERGYRLPSDTPSTISMEVAA